MFLHDTNWRLSATLYNFWKLILDTLYVCDIPVQGDVVQIYPTKKKKRIQYGLLNYDQLKIIDKILIFERNCLKFLSVIDKYLCFPKCMQNLFFFNSMYLL